MRGCYVAAEGLDYSGKTTQIRKLVDRGYLDMRDWMITREPGGTKFAEGIRNLLRDSDYDPEPMAEFFAFNAARADKIIKEVVPSF